MKTPKKKKYSPDPFSDEPWFKNYWRPAMAWSYLFICIFDFVGGPILNAVISYMMDATYHEWNPLTLRGGGLYHFAMAAIVGVATWSRGAEKQIFMKEKTTEEEDDTSDDDIKRRDKKDDEESDAKDEDTSDDPPSDRHKGDDK
jgi:hypothetical protein